MARQRESTYVADIFDNKLKHEGWHVENLHGNAMQEGLPDRVCFKAGRTIFVEYKVIEDNLSIKCTPAQKRKFPILLSHDAEIYCIASQGLKGSHPDTIKEINWLYSLIQRRDVQADKMFSKVLTHTLNPFTKKGGIRNGYRR